MGEVIDRVDVVVNKGAHLSVSVRASCGRYSVGKLGKVVATRTRLTSANPGVRDDIKRRVMLSVTTSTQMLDRSKIKRPAENSRRQCYPPVCSVGGGRIAKP
jgi:hypothetical protein